MAPRLEVGLLGPLTVRVDGVPVRLAGRGRALLAALALAAGRPVTVEALVEAAWGERLPAGARSALQTAVSRLRRELGDGLLNAASDGYALAVDPDDVDVHRFRRLAAGADPERLADALSLWRGEPLQDVPSEGLRQAYGPRLTEERFAAVERRLDLELDAGRHAELVPELLDLTARHPLREPLWRRLMLALYRGNRQGDALEAYQRLRGRLRDELGLDPDPEVRALHQRILSQDPALDAPAATQPAADRAVPRQLPGDIPRFTGRDADLAALDALLDGHRPGPGTTPIVIAAVGGVGGVGKTALAVHWAHRVAGRFPDGQLYANLRGYGPSEPLPPDAVLESFLRALGVPGEQIPAELEARTAEFRSRMAGRRMLVLLDNVRTAEQVRPLLPGGDALVLVTSRNRLRSLAAREGAHALLLDQLPLPESVRLLRAATGEPAPDPDSGPGSDRYAELAELCGRLPLALSIAAEQARHHAGGDLSALVAELRTERDRLDLLDLGESTTDLRAVFSWSYRALPEDAARLFRLLTLHPGADIGTAAAAALADVPVARARRLLGQLVDAHQLEQRLPGRYEFHDLIRTYAAELCEQTDPAPERDAAVRRVLDWYLHTTYRARAATLPGQPVVGIAEPPDGAASLRFDDAEAATSWCDEERTNLMSAVQHAADAGFYSHAWQLPRLLLIYFGRRELADDWITANTAALRAARQLGHRYAEAEALNGLGLAYQEQRADYTRALSHFQQAHAIFRELDDLTNQAHVLSHAGNAYSRLGRFDEAIAAQQRSAELAAASGDANVASKPWINLAWAYVLAGRFQEAVAAGERALVEVRRVVNPALETILACLLGRAHAGLGDQRTAMDHFVEAIRISEQLGDLRNRAEALHHLGRAQRQLGQLDAARESWRGALRVYEEVASPEADEVRDELAALDA